MQAPSGPLFTYWEGRYVKPHAVADCTFRPTRSRWVSESREDIGVVQECDGICFAALHRRHTPPGFRWIVGQSERNVRWCRSGGLLSGGLEELFERFKQNGQGETAQSWINNGPNKQISPTDLKQAIGPDVLATLEERTGLSQQDLLSRLSRELPEAVDKYTPDGQLPVR